MKHQIIIDFIGFLFRLEKKGAKMNKKQLVAKRKARVGRNPRTGESIQIAASQKVKFLPAKSLKEMFNR